MVTMSTTFTVLQTLLTGARRHALYWECFAQYIAIVSPKCINRLVFVVEKPSLREAANQFFRNNEVKFKWCRTAQSGVWCQNSNGAVLHSREFGVKIQMVP